MKGKISLPHFAIRYDEKSVQKFGLRILITKKIKRAVDRNRIKRVIREFFRKNWGLLQRGGVICRVDPKAAELKNEDIFQELSQIL